MKSRWNRPPILCLDLSCNTMGRHCLGEHFFTIKVKFQRIKPNEPAIIVTIFHCSIYWIVGLRMLMWIWSSPFLTNSARNSHCLCPVICHKIIHISSKNIIAPLSWDLHTEISGQLTRVNIPVLALSPVYISGCASYFYNHKEDQICISDSEPVDQCLTVNFRSLNVQNRSLEYTWTSPTSHDKLEIDSHDPQ